jgi:hypothetical protein
MDMDWLVSANLRVCSDRSLLLNLRNLGLTCLTLQGRTENACHWLASGTAGVCLCSAQSMLIRSRDKKLSAKKHLGQRSFIRAIDRPQDPEEVNKGVAH